MNIVLVDTGAAGGGFVSRPPSGFSLSHMGDVSILKHILEVARWAPSGDNSQNWRFEAVSPTHAVIHIKDTRDTCVFDLDGRGTQISLGALLETMSIAASRHGLRMHATRREAHALGKVEIDVHFSSDPQLPPDTLAGFIEQRSVQRRPLKTTPLTADEFVALRRAAGEAHVLVWYGGWARRWQFALLLARSGKIRLTTPETFELHRCAIEWDAEFSADRIPAAAVGVGPMTLALMKWAMVSRRRVDFLNRFLGGTLLPRLQMDVLPALACAGHFVLVRRDGPPASIDDWIDAGRAVQRVWLTATSLRLQLQPEFAPLVFSEYARRGQRFSRLPSVWREAGTLRERFEGVVGPDVLARAVFMGRVGHGPPATARSVRLPLDRLWHEAGDPSTSGREGEAHENRF